MSYTPAFFDDAGLSIPLYTDIQGDMLDTWQSIFGQTVSYSNDSLEYQGISAFALKDFDVNQALELIWHSFNPQFATGVALDNLATIIGIIRKSATPSLAQVTVTGTPGTVINQGIVKDVNGIYWNLPSQVTIPSSTSVSVSATCQTNGNISANAGTITGISTPTGGWTSVTNPFAAIPGAPIETDDQFRARFALSTALPSKTLLIGTEAAIAATAGVTRWNVLENYEEFVDSYGNPPKSVTCVVEGGADLDIATAIYNNRGIGPKTNGTTTVTVVDATTNKPTNIGFMRPTYVPVYVTIQVHGLNGFSAATTTSIQTFVTNYLNSLQIGQTVVWSEIFGAALNARTDPDAPTFSLKSVALDITATPTATADLTLLFNQVAQAATITVTPV